MRNKINKKGNMNAFSILSISIGLLLLISSVGYLIGAGAGINGYNVSIDTRFNNVDIQNLTGIEYFTNGTLEDVTSYNQSNITQTESGMISATNALYGTRDLIKDMVLITPLAGTAFGDLIDELIVGFFGLIILVLIVQLITGRNLTS